MNKYKCRMCSKIISAGKAYLGSHAKRVHGIGLHEYCNQYMTTDNTSKDIKCVSCNEKIEPLITIDFEKNSFNFRYDGYLCRNTRNSPSLYCKNNISLEVLGLPYDKLIYEHIGAKKEYLSLKYGISTNEAKKLKIISAESILKNNPDITNASEVCAMKIDKMNSKPCTTSLSDYIRRCGTEMGTELYNNRNRKIARSNTLEYYIEKYGKDGESKWIIRNNAYKKMLGPNISKASHGISNMLISHNLNFESEYKIRADNKIVSVDFYLYDYDIVIEFFGDYWHCNPLKYASVYEHKILKMQASDIWKKDKNRLAGILVSNTNVSILVIWEETSKKIKPDELMEIINNIKNKKTIFII